MCGLVFSRPARGLGLFLGAREARLKSFPPDIEFIAEARAECGALTHRSALG